MRRPYVLYPFIAVLIAMNVWMLYSLAFPQPPRLEVHVLDIGQGDAILLETSGGTDVLIDGGPDRSVLRRLPAKLGLFDRHIDLVIATHRDKDHIAGLIETFERYQVSYFIESGTVNDTSYSDALTEAVAHEPDLVTFIARRGMRIELGNGAYADVLFPDRDVSRSEPNDGSVVLRVVFGETSFLFAGDLSANVEDYLASLDGAKLRSDVLKASHHGSSHSTSETLLGAVDPDVVVISAGKDNPYGHPAPAALERIRASGARVVSTIEEGTITFVSDGARIIRK